MNFKGRTVIVTGAAQGIGYETALEFAECGANVVITDIDSEKIQKVREEILALGVKCSAYAFDVSDERAVGGTAESVIKEYGKIDVLVNNAGIYNTGNGPFVNSSSDDWRRKIDINILGTMYFTQAVIKNMIDNSYGRIVNIGSVAGVYGLHEWAAYSMTKGAVISFTLALAKELGQYGITVNAVSPGNIHPPHTYNYPDMSWLKRSGTPRECANVICFLASEEASYVSGQNYLVDGARRTI